MVVLLLLPPVLSAEEARDLERMKVLQAGDRPLLCVLIGSLLLLLLLLLRALLRLLLRVLLRLFRVLLQLLFRPLLRLLRPLLPLLRQPFLRQGLQLLLGWASWPGGSPAPKTEGITDLPHLRGSARKLPSVRTSFLAIVFFTVGLVV